MAYERLKGLLVEDYQYPGDDVAYVALKKIPLMEQLVSLFLKFFVEIDLLPEVRGDYFRATKETCPGLHRIYRTALDRLDMPEEYPLYIKSDFEYNAMAVGGKSPFLILHSSMAQNLNEPELLGVLGHELGHLKGGHTVYYNMTLYLSQLLHLLPAGQFLSVGAWGALMNWQRLQEFSADRAGALAAGSVEAQISVLERLMGTDDAYFDIHFDLEDLLAQKVSFEAEQSDMLGKLIYMMQTFEQSHPWTVLRIQALHDWKTSREFDAVLKKYAGHHDDP